jgi:hypothetical protein
VRERRKKMEAGYEKERYISAGKTDKNYPALEVLRHCSDVPSVNVLVVSTEGKALGSEGFKVMRTGVFCSYAAQNRPCA